MGRRASSLRLLFFGTPDFAVPSLRRLLEGPDEVVGVVSQPDRGRGRGRQHKPSPVAEVALEHELPLLRPEKVGAPDAVGALRELDADLGVVVAFGQFLTRQVRELPSLGFLINGHASLLPRHRGAAPIAYAILAGDRETGVSVMRVEREMDAGPVLLERSLVLDPAETTGTLTERLAPLTADALVDGVARIRAGEASFEPQDDTRATLAPRILPKDAELDFREPAVALARRVRAMAPKPGAFATLGGERLRILMAEAREDATPHTPGTILEAGARVAIATGDGVLDATALQRPGGRPLPAEDFLRGHPIPVGQAFETPEPDHD